MSIIIQEKFTLDERHIDYIAEKVTEFAYSLKIDKKEALRTRLTLEELLLKVIKQGQESINCELILEKKFGTGYIQIYYDGGQYNPIVDSENSDELSNQILINLGLNPIWKYKDNRNRISFSFKTQKKSSIFFILGAIALAVVLGVLGQVIPEAVKEPVSEFLLQPMSKAFLGLLNIFAGIIIFSAIITGINSSGDLASFGKIGKRMLTRFFIILFVVAIITILIQLPFYHLNWSGQADAGESQVSKISEMLWGMLPNNIVQPFIDGNFMHVMIIAFMVGLAMLVLKEQSEGLRAFFNELSAVLLFIMKKICNLLPIFIFVVLLNKFWEGSFSTIIDMWKPILTILLLCISMTIIYLIIAGLKLGVKPFKLFKAILPAWIIGLTTSSTISAYSSILNILEEKFGVSKKFSRVGLPISNQIFSPTKVMYFLTVVIFFAEKYAVSVDMSWLFIAVILCVTISMAAPPIPGAILVCFGMLSSGLGIPSEAIAIIVTVDFIIDSINTATVCALRTLELTLQANNAGELDKNKLKQL